MTMIPSVHSTDARIDVHTHIGVDQAFYLRGWWPYAATIEDLRGHLDRHGLTHACMFPFCVSSAYDPLAFADRHEIELLPGRFPYDRENAMLTRELELVGYRSRFLVLAMVDPARKVQEQVQSLGALQGRIHGLKLQGTIIQSRVALFLSEARGILELAEQEDYPVLIHTSVHPEDPWSQVSDCLAVAREFPKVRFNLAHSLRFDLPCLKEAAEMPNVWVDCAAHLAHCSLAVKDSPAVAPANRRLEADYANPAAVLEAVAACLPKDKYLWGSDNPFMSWCEESLREIHTYEAEIDALRAAPEALQESMLRKAPQSWIGDKQLAALTDLE